MAYDTWAHPMEPLDVGKMILVGQAELVSNLVDLAFALSVSCMCHTDESILTSEGRFALIGRAGKHLASEALQTVSAIRK